MIALVVVVVVGADVLGGGVSRVWIDDIPYIHTYLEYSQGKFICVRTQPVQKIKRRI